MSFINQGETDRESQAVGRELTLEEWREIVETPIEESWELDEEAEKP
jgi:hypothetical protein